MKHVLAGIVRAALIGLVIGGSLAAAMWWAGCQLLNSTPSARASEGRSAVVAVNPDPRIEWQQHPVGGLFLCGPQDSTRAGLRCFTIPAGSLLLIPEVASDTTRRTRHRRGS